jgi:hypothetical protein
MEVQEFSDSLESINGIISEYTALETNPPEHAARLQVAEQH